MIDWAASRKIFFTTSRPYKKNDQATIESKNNHLVRRYGFYWRYDAPKTPLERLLEAEVSRPRKRPSYALDATGSTPPRSPAASSPSKTGSPASLVTPPSTPKSQPPHHQIPATESNSTRRADPRFRGHSHLRHGEDFAGTLT